MMAGTTLQKHQPRVLPVIRLLAKPVFVDRANDGNFHQRVVEVGQSHTNGVPERLCDGDQQGDHRDIGKCQPKQSYQLGIYNGKKQECDGKMPEPEHRRGMNGAAGKEIGVAEGRGAGVECQPFAEHPQVNALSGKQPAFGVFHAGHFHAGDFPVGHCLFDGCRKIPGAAARVRRAKEIQ